MVALPETIRIFPLGGVVLFPDTLLPLHIFETRYRKMLADALETDKLIGMVLLKDAKSNDGDADIYPVGCAGSIVAHEPQEDGRSHILLKGVAKFRIREELETDKPNRVVRAQGLYEAISSIVEARRWHGELVDRVRTFLDFSGKDEQALLRVFDKADPGLLVNYLCAALPLSVTEKQSLLECPTLERRFELLTGILDFKAAEARLGLDTNRETDA